MDLLEYQAKELFHSVGIPVLPAQRIDTPADVKRLEIPYPIVLKSQVSAGNRAKVGGVRFVENTIDAIAASRTLFDLAIGGKYPEVLLAEAKYDASEEFYLAAIVDTRLRCVVLLGAKQGGSNIAEIENNLQQIAIDGDFSAFLARKLALKMGLTGDLMLRVGDIFEKIYHLLVDFDLDFVEINPLGVSAGGEVMALDGKIAVNDHALDRQPQFAGYATEPKLPLSMWSATFGNIATISSGAGVALACLDGIAKLGGSVSKSISIDSQSSKELQIALQYLADTSVRVILIDILVPLTADRLEILSHFAATGKQSIVWRAITADETNGDLPFIISPSLDRAIAAAIRLSPDPDATRV
jgi:succinyl-CoA synthetase beta subunit